MTYFLKILWQNFYETFFDRFCDRFLTVLGVIMFPYTIYSETDIFFTFCFYSFKMVSGNLTFLVLTCGKWSIFLVKVEAKVLVLTTTLFFFRNFYIFLVYIKLIVNRNLYVMKIKTKTSTWYKLKKYRNFWKNSVIVKTRTLASTLTKKILHFPHVSTRNVKFPETILKL